MYSLTLLSLDEGGGGGRMLTLISNIANSLDISLIPTKLAIFITDNSLEKQDYGFFFRVMLICTPVFVKIRLFKLFYP